MLYARLREADDARLDVLLVVRPPVPTASGAAVADRLRARRTERQEPTSAASVR